MITKFICKECQEIKIEVWMLGDSEHGDNWCESCRERSKREDVFVIKGSNECIAIDAIPSKECREYHENSYIQINGQLRRCGALNTQETE